MNESGKSLGAAIAELRKKQGMTQLELADKLGVTDKAVSKWERDLSCPDIGSLPKLAAELGISVDELLHANTGAAAKAQQEEDVPGVFFKAITLAMGVAVTVLGTMGKLDVLTGVRLLGLGMLCAGLALLIAKK